MTDNRTAIMDAIKEFGGTDAQAEDAAFVLLDKVGTVRGITTLIATGADIRHPKSREWLEQNKPHLLPKKFERSLADRAFLDGNISARGALLREVGENEATRIAQCYGLRSLHDTRRGERPADAADGSDKKNGTADHRDNPWSAAGWNISRQGAIVRSLGVAKAAQMAASVRSRIGATKPSM